MKCYTIQSGNEYIADEYQVIRRSWRGNVLLTVNEADEAKHYKTPSAPKAWLKKQVKQLPNKLKVIKEKIKEEKRSVANNGAHNWQLNRYHEQFNTLVPILNWLQNASVVELNLEKPNFPADYKLKWRTYYRRYGASPTADHSSNMKLQQVSHSRYECKACGVILKNIPYYEVYTGNPTKICVGCLYMRLEAIKTAFESMPEDFRNELQNELILGSI